MPLWFGLLLTLLGWLVQWLLTRSQKDGLDSGQVAKLNDFIAKAREAEALAVSMGCTPGGASTSP